MIILSRVFSNIFPRRETQPVIPQLEKSKLLSNYSEIPCLATLELILDSWGFNEKILFTKYLQGEKRRGISYTTF